MLASREMSEARAPEDAGRPRSGYHICWALREPKGLIGRDPLWSMAVPWESRGDGGHVTYSSVSRTFSPRVGQRYVPLIHGCRLTVDFLYHSWVGTCLFSKIP